MKRGCLYIAILIFGILLIGLASAGLWQNIKDAITGQATNQPTNVSVTVTGANQVNVTVDNSTLTGGVTPIEGTSTSSEFYVTVCDPDGVSDINDSSIQAEFSKVGESTRTNSSCVLIGDLDTYCANYTCTIDTWYFDGTTSWTINASATDLGNTTRIYNDSFTFSMNLLKAMAISPSQINWTSITPGDTDAKADNDPTTINNTGNYNGTINVTGLDLYGEIVTTEVFGVDNFTSGIADDCTTSGVYLANNSQVLITNSVANRGNLSAGGGAGQEELYYCIPNVPTVSSQEYTTSQLGSWTILY